MTSEASILVVSSNEIELLGLISSGFEASGRSYQDFSDSLSETVWKKRISFTSGSKGWVKRGEKPLYYRFGPPRIRLPNPSSYFPNSFRGEIPGNQASAK